MNILVPIYITNAMMVSSTIAEPDTFETEWNPATSYEVGDRIIRTTTHRVYECLIAGVNATLPEVAQTHATPRWLEYDPTNRWAAFDDVVNTGSQATTLLTYVLSPGLFNAIALYGLEGESVTVTVKDEPGGDVIYTHTASLFEPPIDYYNYYFGAIRSLKKLVMRNITPYANAEVTITITAADTVPVAVGMIAIGDMRSLITNEIEGGTQYGANAEPVTYSYINTDKFGKTTIRRRHSTTDMRVRVLLPQYDADAALLTVQEVLDVPCAWVATDEDGYQGLNVFGLGSGVLSYDGPKHATLSLTIKGFI